MEVDQAGATALMRLPRLRRLALGKPGISRLEVHDDCEQVRSLWRSPHSEQSIRAYYDLKTSPVTSSVILPFVFSRAGLLHRAGHIPRAKPGVISWRLQAFQQVRPNAASRGQCLRVVVHPSVSLGRRVPVMT